MESFYNKKRGCLSDMPNFAANISMMFNEYEFLDRFSAAAAAGFRAVEFLFPYEYSAEEIKTRLDKFELKQVLFNTYPGDWEKNERGLASIPGREGEFEQAVDLALDYAEVLENQHIHAMSGLVKNRSDFQKHRTTLVENLKRAAPVAAARGKSLIIEPINTRDIPGYFLNYQNQARRIIEDVAAENVKLQFDLYHCQIMEGDLAEHLKEFLDITVHMQIAGTPGRHEPNIGEINYKYLFQLMDQLGYDGWVGCEYRPKGETVAGLGWMQDM